MKRLLYWIGLLIGITACVNPKGEDVLAEAERLMQAYPDSALSLLEQAEKESATYPRRNRMHYRLLQARNLSAPQPDALPVASSRSDEQGISPARLLFLIKLEFENEPEFG